MSWKHFIFPHPHTHKKAHLISWQAILIYVLLFIFLQVSFSIFSTIKPGVLGISSNVDQHQLIDLTNAERAKLNLGPLSENSELDQAAAEKAKNMFAEDYWAHYSPSGKDPWGFINGSGYKFTYAGENLARNFYNSNDVVVAWMNSPSHRENIVNPRYKEIGMAVAEGTLKGQNTILVVQMFGTPVEAIATSPSDQTTPNAGNNPAEVVNRPNVLPAVKDESSPITVKAPLIDPYKTLKALGLVVISIIFALLLVDLYVIKKRGVVRVASRHIPHLVLLGLGAGALFNMHPGSIL